MKENFCFSREYQFASSNMVKSHNKPLGLYIASYGDSGGLIKGGGLISGEGRGHISRIKKLFQNNEIKCI